MEVTVLDNVGGVEGVTRATGSADGGGNAGAWTGSVFEAPELGACQLFGEEERLDKSCLNLSRFLVPTGSPGMLPDNTPGVDGDWADERSTGT